MVKGYGGISLEMNFYIWFCSVHPFHKKATHYLVLSIIVSLDVSLKGGVLTSYTLLIVWSKFSKELKLGGNHESS